MYIKDLIEYTEEKLQHLKDYASLVEQVKADPDNIPLDDKLIELEEYIIVEYGIELDSEGEVVDMNAK